MELWLWSNDGAKMMEHTQLKPASHSLSLLSFRVCHDDTVFVSATLPPKNIKESESTMLLVTAHLTEHAKHTVFNHVGHEELSVH